MAAEEVYADEAVLGQRLGGLASQASHSLQRDDDANDDKEYDEEYDPGYEGPLDRGENPRHGIERVLHETPLRFPFSLLAPQDGQKTGAPTTVPTRRGADELRPP